MGLDAATSSATLMTGSTTDQNSPKKENANSHLMTEEQKLFNYIMSGVGLLMLLLVAAVAKGLYEWRRRGQFRPAVPHRLGPTTSREAWSGSTKKKTVHTGDHLIRSSSKTGIKKNTNGLVIQPTVPMLNTPQESPSIQIDGMKSRQHPLPPMTKISDSLPLPRDTTCSSENDTLCMPNVEIDDALREKLPEEDILEIDENHVVEESNRDKRPEDENENEALS